MRKITAFLFAFGLGTTLSALEWGTEPHLEPVANNAYEIEGYIEQAEMWPLELYMHGVLIPTYVHELGHKYRIKELDNQSADVRITNYGFSGKTKNYLEPFNRNTRLMVKGAGLETEQMLASLHRSSLLSNNDRSHFGNVVGMLRFKGNALRQWFVKGDITEYLEILGRSSQKRRLKRFLILQWLDPVLINELMGRKQFQWDFNTRLHLSDNGVEFYHDIRFKTAKAGTHQFYIREGHKIWGSGIHSTFGDYSIELHHWKMEKNSFGGAIKRNFSEISSNVHGTMEIGYKDSGTLVGKPSKSGLFWSAGLKINF